MRGCYASDAEPGRGAAADTGQMGAFIQKLHVGLRSGSWLTRERMRLWALAVLAASAAGTLYIVATSNGLIDYQGRPLGTDFSNVYAAGTYVLDGRADLPFSPEAQYAREQAIFGAATPFYGWHYPPFFLFIAALLATMPYALALLVWQGTTLAFYLGVVFAILARAPSRSDPAADESANLNVSRLWWLLALAYPAVFINIGHGHNGFLTAALIGGALLTIDRRPLVAGVLIGLLAYKPQFGILIPLVLIATGRWRVFATAAATVAALIAVTTLCFGTDVWTAFFASTHFTRVVVLEEGQTGWQKIQSVFSWVRMWGGPVPLAYAIQGAVTCALAFAVIWLWRGRASFAFKAAGLVVASFLATPYTLDYDMMVLAIAIAFLAAHGLRNRFAPFEVTALAALWIVPLIARSIAEATLVPIGVIVVVAFFVVIVRRSCAIRDDNTGTVQAHLTRT
jgi:alpha-1,2-mannosyltransferase